MKLRALLLAALTACGASPPPLQPAERPSTAARELSIVGTNDLHGHVESLPLLAGYLELLRADRPVLLLDAGDMLHGTLASNLTEGAVVIDAYSALGYDAAAIGNHELDFGQDVLKERLRQARFPLLAANLVTRTPWPGLGRSVMLEVSGLRIGVVGALTEETPDIVMPGLFEGMDVSPIAATVHGEAAELRRRGAELVVLLAHAGGKCERFEDPHDASSCSKDSEIARVLAELPHGTVDLAIAGHTHRGMAHYLSGVPVLEAFAYGRALSRIDVRADAARPSFEVHAPRFLCADPEADVADCQPASYAGEAVERDAAIGRLIEPALQRAEQTRSRELGVTVTAPVGAAFLVESALGNLFADLLREAVPGADVGLMNGGGVRAPLPSGELTYGDLYQAMPFDNRVASVRLTGRELGRVLAEHLQRGRHGIVALSGVRLRARCTGGTLEVELERDSGERVTDDAELLIATSDYIVMGGDELLSAVAPAPDRIQISSEPLRDAFARRLTARGPRLDGASPALFDPAAPRLALPTPRPVRCP